MMAEGDRQVAPTLDGIRKDHVERYKFAAHVLPKESRVIDFAAGCGYGTRILADAGHDAIGFDCDTDALEYARKHYTRHDSPQGMFRLGNGNAPGELGEANAAVCFETIEHLEDPRPLLKALRVSAPMLIASVPNESVFPFSPAEGITTAFHFRHYTRFDFNELLRECGWCAVDWYGQAGPESEVEQDVNGRTLIAVCQRDVLPEENTTSGKRVAILGLGPSLNEYLEITKRQGGRSALFDEVWAINALGDVFACDLVFHMDDVRIQEIRAAAAPASNIAAMLPWLKTSKVPVVTSRAHPDYPALVEYPLEDVLNHFGHEYFNSTAAYAVAFAIHIGAVQISIFGFDVTYPNRNDAEKGRGCVEYWMGQAHARGIKLLMPKITSLMDACHSRAERLYGYDCVNVDFRMQPDGSVKLDFNEREKLPTAEELEKFYDHSAPISEQHLKPRTST